MNRAQRRAMAKQTSSRSKVGISALAVTSLVAGNVALLPPSALAAPVCMVNTISQLANATLNNACTTITITANLNFGAAEGIVIDHDVLIQGDVSGAAAVIDANGFSQIFAIAAENVAQHSDDGDIDVTLKNLVLREGAAVIPFEFGSRSFNSGGAVSAMYANSEDDVPVSLTLDSVAFIENVAGDEGGAVFVGVGSVTTTGTTSFEDNASEWEGGAIYVADGNVTIGGATSFISNGTFGTGEGLIENERGGAIYISDGNVSISGTLTFTDNYANERGGAIYIFDGNVTISGTSTFTDNHASDDGGAIYISDGNVSISGTSTFTDNYAGDDGGAIFTYDGNITISDTSTFTDNYAGDDGGAIYTYDGNVSISGTSTFTDNYADDNGGAIYTYDGNVSISGTSTFTNNDADDNGGAIFTYDGNVSISGTSTFTNNDADIHGGAIYAGSYYGDSAEGNVLLAGTSTFTNNDAGDNGGAIYAEENVTISGTATFINNDADIHGGAIYTDEDLTISGTATFTTNTAGGDGGAVYVEDYVTITGTATFTSNTAGNDGGAVYVENDEMYIEGNATVRFINNSAGDDGGAIYSEGNDIEIRDSAYVLFQGNTASEGGAIYIDGFDDLFVKDAANVIFRNNIATSDGGAVYLASLRVQDYSTVIFENNSAARGGAIYAEDVVRMDFDAKLSFVGNSATSNAGGAIWAQGAISLHNVYFGDNSAFGHGGAIYSRDNVFIENSTFFNNRAGDEGGAIFVDYHPEGSEVVLSTFQDNTAAGSDGDAPGQSIYTGQVFKLLGNIFASSSTGLAHLGEGLVAPEFRDLGGNFSTSEQDAAVLTHSSSKVVAFADLAISTGPVLDSNYPDSNKVIPIAAESFAADGVDITELSENIAQLTLAPFGLTNLDQRGVIREMKYDSGSYEVGMRVMPVEVVIVAPKVVLPSAPPRVGVKRDGRKALKVEWSTPTTAGTGKIIRYEIYRNGRKIATLPSTTRSFRDIGLDSNQSYTYRVVTVGSQGSSIKSVNSNAIFPRK